MVIGQRLMAVIQLKQDEHYSFYVFLARQMSNRMDFFTSLYKQYYLYLKY